MPSGCRPQLSPQSHLGTSAPRPHLTHGPNEVLRAAFWKHRLSSGNKPQCKCTFAQQSNACLILPQISGLHKPKKVWAASGCLGPAALLVVS